MKIELVGGLPYWDGFLVASGSGGGFSPTGDIPNHPQFMIKTLWVFKTQRVW